MACLLEVLYKQMFAVWSRRPEIAAIKQDQDGHQAKEKL